MRASLAGMARLTSTSRQLHGCDVGCHHRRRRLLQASNAKVRPDGTEAALSVFDPTSLKATLEELVDFDLINRGEVRLSVGAVNVCKGTSTYFDTKNTLIHSDHIRASGALPPGSRR